MRVKKLGLLVLSIALATTIWLPTLHVLFRPNEEELTQEGVSPRARALATRHLGLWEDAGALSSTLKQMRVNNPEWDFMGRTFLVLALANMAERDPESRPRLLAVIDRIVADTLRLERERGQPYFLMSYASHRPWVAQPPRSLFVDGEIALMLAARCLVEDRPDYHAGLADRVRVMSARMQANPKTLSAESYPDECWAFCNAVALAAIRIGDRVLGQDHSAFLAAWISNAKQNLVHKETGLLVSKYTLSGEVGDGPEGSSIWMALHCLWIVDEAFARDQYERARLELGKTLLGFGYAREWPVSWANHSDVDSGPIVPYLEASAGSSGLALLGAATAGDRDYQASLIASLDLAAFPLTDSQGGLRYGAGSQVGDAVLLYSLVCGPLWEKLPAKSP
ncbi:MAG: hypothetical protein JKY65_12070 [Planctomycetes bacterium]|nr:hypothetical protein [Planctomycetota bacterium]